MTLRPGSDLRWLVALALVVIATSASRGRAGESAERTDPATAPRDELGGFVAPLDSLDGWVEMDVFEINLDAERAWKVGLDWPSRAFDVAMRAVGDVEARLVDVALEREGVEGPSAIVVVTRVGLADDSIGGFRDELDLALQLDGSWRVVTHWRSVFCPRGPGRGAWMAGPCR